MRQRSLSLSVSTPSNSPFNTRTGAITLSSTDVTNALTFTPLGSTDIGVSIQAYDVDTAKYDDTTANFTGTLQNGGSNVLVDSDIGVNVQAYDSNLTSFVSTFTLPTTDGTTGQIIQTDGSGNLTFTSASGGITTGKAIAMAIVFG